jgi:hypothetical protein
MKKSMHRKMSIVSHDTYDKLCEAVDEGLLFDAHVRLYDPVNDLVWRRIGNPVTREINNERQNWRD